MNFSAPRLHDETEKEALKADLEKYEGIFARSKERTRAAGAKKTD